MRGMGTCHGCQFVRQSYDPLQGEGKPMSTLDCTDSDFGLGAELEEIRRQVRRFAAERIAPRAADIDRRNEFPRDLWRSEEHTSELQSQSNLVCRLMLAKNTRPGLLRGSCSAWSSSKGRPAR